MHRSAQESLNTAAEASQRKSRFLAEASHDLRQPIHAISLFAAALAERPLEGRTRYLVDRLHRSLAGLDELFNRLLDISKLDTGTIDPQIASFPINPLLQTLEARFGQLAQNRNIEFRVRVNSSASVRSDPALLIEIVMNLLSNAFRYTEKGGVLLATRRRQDKLLIQIWDTGPGIAPDNLERIFQEFVQLDNPSRDRRKGLGLGLAIVRRIAQSMQHSIAVRSRVGRGSVFEIVVPIAERAREVTQIALPVQSDITGLLVIVVDDEIDVLLATEALLTSWGCFAILARNIPEALSQLAACERFPDALISDNSIAQGVSSFEVIEAIRAVVPIELRVAVVSGDANPQLESKVRTAGWSYLTKPIKPEKLRVFLSGTAV